MVVVSAQNNLQGLQGEISLAVPLTFQENKMTLKHPKKKKIPRRELSPVTDDGEGA